ncbi:DUF202 domain-containing protein [Nocardiopsis gilva YIM 90087]|uniref:DUF202 domain-containing protein n=1 Tax=Nocardiopsis gilva YIM 90087 TaxID=1235441 RepID=A0A223S1H9_9ACTN|nr:DUF202 domain-containing protein [Nocardiopsis gilva]ASU81947.1 DUF202 domain-containing protein [Nocardiopsis gilva YIM 90087]
MGRADPRRARTWDAAGGATGGTSGGTAADGGDGATGARPEDRDAGLQPERTFLAWQRTLIVIFVVALLYLRDPFQNGASGSGSGPDPIFRLAAVLVVAVAVGILMAHLRRRWRATDQGLHDDATGNPPAPLASPWAIYLLSGSAAAIATVVAVSALFGFG